ncbi:MAG: DapH/DapD/GlmU-related protein [bacterium]
MKSELNTCNIRPNVLTNFSRAVSEPELGEGSYVSPEASVIGNVIIGERVYLGPQSFVRGDEGQPILVGDDCNIQDCAGIHGLETEEQDENGNWHFVEGRRFSADGRRLSQNDDTQGYTVWLGKRISIAHQALVHGPAWVGEGTFVGMQSLVFNAKVGRNVVVGVKSVVTEGVVIPDNAYIPAGSVITTQEQADNLGKAAGTPYERLNDAVVHVNISLAKAYNKS